MLSCLSTSFGTASTFSHFGERFRDGNGHYSLVSFLFAVSLLTVPPCPAICKNEGTCPRALWSRRYRLLSIHEAQRRCTPPC